MKTNKFLPVLMMLLITVLFTLPALASFSPLDDPEERYDFEYREGKYRINLNYNQADMEDQNDSEIIFDFESEIKYSVGLEYNLKQGLKVRVNKYWMPEYSETVTDIFNTDTDTWDFNNWGLEFIYKPAPTSHELTFNYQSINENRLRSNDFHEYSSSNEMDSFTISYTPDITTGGLGVILEYNEYNRESNRDDDLAPNIIIMDDDLFRNEYSITVSYEGEI